MTASAPHLSAGFVTACRAVGATAPEHDLRAAAAALERRWAAPDRGYHDLRHLEEVLGHLGDLDAATPELVLAAWFHDAVYDGRPGRDERASARLAFRTLADLGVDASTGRRVAELVLVTAGHVPATDDDGAAALCDADLAVLASPQGRYAAYVAGVRREYQHLDDAAFAVGRTAVLRALADRAALFWTVEGHRRWDTDARRNLQRELAGDFSSLWTSDDRV